jgi:hypothetical protein
MYVFVKYVCVVCLLIKRNRHDHFNTIRSHRLLSVADANVVHLARFFRLSLPLSLCFSYALSLFLFFSLWMGAQRRKKRNEEKY